MGPNYDHMQMGAGQPANTMKPLTQRIQVTPIKYVRDHGERMTKAKSIQNCNFQNLSRINNLFSWPSFSSHSRYGLSTMYNTLRPISHKKKIRNKMEKNKTSGLIPPSNVVKFLVIRLVLVKKKQLLQGISYMIIFSKKITL